MQHQREALSQAICQWHYDRKGTIVAIPVGGGKTMVGMGFQKYTGMKALLVCPTSIKAQWAREILKFIGATSVVIPNGKTPQQRAKIWAKAAEENPDFIICNFEQVRLDYEHIPRRDLVIIDEAHRYKNPKSKNSKQMVQYRRHKAKVCLLLTGTFLINAKHDAWNLMRLAGYPFEDSMKNFEEKYCYVDEKFGKVIGWKPQIKGFLETLRKVTYYRSKAELMKDLPPRHEIIHEVELGPGQRKFYEQIRAGEITYLDALGREVTDANLKAVWARCGQAAAIPSVVRLEDHDGNPLDIKVPDESAKLDWMKDFLQDFDDDYMIVFSLSTRVLDAIQAAFPDEPWVRIDGSVDGAARQAVIDQARESGKAYFLISGAIKEGANLQFCNQLVFFTLPMTDADRVQIEGRIWRTGQQRQSNIHYVIALGTTDEDQYRMLQAKGDLMGSFAGLQVV
jgi:SNF2 family DNA or RNA helicase